MKIEARLMEDWCRLNEIEGRLVEQFLHFTFIVDYPCSGVKECNIEDDN